MVLYIYGMIGVMRFHAKSTRQAVYNVSIVSFSRSQVNRYVVGQATIEIERGPGRDRRGKKGDGEEGRWGREGDGEGREVGEGGRWGRKGDGGGREMGEGRRWMEENIEPVDIVSTTLTSNYK